MERVLFDKVWKMYDRRYGSNRFRRLPQALLGMRPDQHEFWALRDVSFQIEEGRSFGIVGPNGSGKTTILRILSGITHINRGRVRVRGKVSALIALGAGFHPELTGRENIYLNGSILGLKPAEIRRYFDDIVDFADIGQFMDSPVKRYSSGMFVRLGFAVAAQVRPQVLLVDEVLAVGDSRFQTRCHERIAELRRQGTIIILVSHDTWAIRRSCAEGILLREGRIEARGDIAHVLESYDKMTQRQALERLYEKRRPDDSENSCCRTDLRIHDEAGNRVSEIPLGEPVTFRLFWRCDAPVEQPNLVLSITAHQGPCAIILRSRKANWGADRIEGDGFADVRIENLRLNPGRYAVQFVLKDRSDLTTFASSRFQELYVRPPDANWCAEDCLYVPEAKWSEPREGEFAAKEGASVPAVPAASIAEGGSLT